MAYIGREPQIGNFQVCDAISVVNGQAAYTMQVNSVNVSPETANHMLVSLNGVLQAPGSSYTVSGSTITFASNLVTGDVIDFIHILGSVLDLGVPSDNTVTAAKLGANSVTAAKLNNDIISGSTELASEPADTDEFLVSDAGTLKRIDYSLIKASGIEEIDMWRITTDFRSDGVSDITANWERADDSGWSVVGSGMSESSGIFTFPSTGYWQINSSGFTQSPSGLRDFMGFGLSVTTNNSSYQAAVTTYGDANGSDAYASPNFSYVLNVSNTSNVKVKMFMQSASGSDIIAMGNSSHQSTGLIFIKLRGL